MGWAWFKRLVAAEDGSIAVLGALALVSTLGMSGLAVEVGNGYAAKIRNQRVADMAALGAAIAYKNSGQTGSAGALLAQDVASAIATANGQTNGVNGATVTATPDNMTAPTKITVIVTTPVPVRLASIAYSGATSFNVTNSATASLASSGSSAGCITALGTSATAVSADGGAKILASGCAINTNGTIYSSNTSATVTAKQMAAYAINDPATSWGGQGVITNPTARNWTLGARSSTDPIKDNAAVKAALCAVNKLAGTTDTYDATSNPYGYVGGNTGCTNPLVAPTSYSATGAADVTFTSGSSPPAGYAAYYDNNGTYTLPGSSYTFGNVTVNGGVTVRFTASNITLAATSITMNGATMSIGNGSVKVSGNLNVNANNPITIGNGAHSFGSLTIGGGKKLDVGSGNFNLTGGVSVSGGAYLKVNIAADNTVTIGADSSGNSISVSGGSQVCFTSDCSAPTAAAGTFSAGGNINNDGGGSNIVFPNAMMHVINGNVSLAAAAIFGKGLYVIKGNWTNGTGCGGCAMTGTEVTFAMGGTFSFGGGTSFDLAAPTASSTYGIPDVLLVTKSTSATAISAGSTGKASGLIYAPNSAFSSSGGSSISSNGSACMMLVVSSISVTGSGTVNTSNCSSIASGGGGSGTVALIQ